MVPIYVEVAILISTVIVISLDKFEVSRIWPALQLPHQVYLSHDEQFLRDNLETNPYNLLYAILKLYYNIGDRAIPQLITGKVS